MTTASRRVPPTFIRAHPQIQLGECMSELTDEQAAILEALNTLTEPAGCKVIGETADMPWRTVMGKLRGLKKGEYVESPEKGKYVISEKGRASIS